MRHLRVNVLSILIISHILCKHHRTTGVVQPPTQCILQPPQKPIETAVKLDYIWKLSNGIFNEFAGPDSQCFRLVSVRVYGALQLSSELIEHGDTILDTFARMTNESAERRKYAEHQKATFRELFENCASVECMVHQFCDKLAGYIPVGEILRAQVHGNCEYDGWRLRNFILSGVNNGICDFDIVPMHWAYLKRKEEFTTTSSTPKYNSTQGDFSSHFANYSLVQKQVQCPDYQVPVATRKHLTRDYIQELSNGIYNEFAESDSQCFRLISVRLYGSLKLSQELLNRCMKK